MNLERTSNRSSRWRFLALAGIASVALFLNVWGNTFPLGYHFDEPKKVRFIKTFEQDFHHPVLMLEVARAANLLFNFEDNLAIAIMARWTIALAGVAIAVMVFLLSRHGLGTWGALLAALMTAVMPTIVLHSHYIKEDIYLTLFSLMTLGLFSVYLREPSKFAAICTGLPMGLAFSSHYKSLLLLPVLAIFVLLAKRQDLVRHGLMIAISVLTGIVVFLLVNSVIFEQPDVFWSGFNYERKHAVQGHTVPIFWYHFGMSYHLFHSVIPGMTWPAAIAGICGFLFYLPRFDRLTDLEKLLIVFGFISYIVPEISPTKPPPDDCRYILPLIPVLVYFSSKMFVGLWNQFGHRISRVVIAFVVAIVVGFAAWDSIMLDYYMVRDSRAEAHELVEKRGFNAQAEPMAGPGITGTWGFHVDVKNLQRQGITHYIVSSFGYQQFEIGSQLSDQPDYVAGYHSRYQRLFERPVIKIEPRHRQFGFSNPTVIIVDIRPETE